MSRKRKVAVAVLAFAAAVAGSWFYFQSKVIDVWVYTDYAFRFNHPKWPATVEARFREVNRIYQRSRTGIRWKVLSSAEIDPTSDAPGIDSRRATMTLHMDRKTDIFVILTGVQEGTRTGSVSPFTRAAVIEDFPGKSELLNARMMAHELAILFGAPRDPAGFGKLIGEKPESGDFSDRTAELIRRMRDYPFALGIDGLSKGSWAKKALAALAEDDTAPHDNPTAHAHTVMGTALLNERKSDLAAAQFLLAVKADPQNKIARLDLVEAYTRNAQDGLALAQGREVVKLAPGDAVSHRVLGALLARNHQPDAAVQEMQTAVRLDPGDADNQVLLGLQLTGMIGHFDDAIAAFDEALRIDPKSVRARAGLERTQALKQRVAFEVAKQRGLVQNNPNDPDANYRLAKAEAAAGDLKAAIRDFQKSAVLRPDNGSPHLELAELYLLTGNADTAWAEVRKARALGSEPPPALMSQMPAQK